MIEISTTHVVRLCVSSRGRTRIVGDANIDGNQDGEDVDKFSDEEEEEDSNDIVDLEDIAGKAPSRKNGVVKVTKRGDGKKEMVTPVIRASLTKQV